MQPTAWASRELARQSRASLKVHARRQLHFALALRVVLTESEDEMRSTVSVSLPNWAHVDDITMATTAEPAPFVKTKLKWTFQRHGLELRSDKCAAFCPTKARTSQIREEMTQFLKWKPSGIMILGMTSDDEVQNGDHDTSSEKSRTHK